ncbi:MAG: flagellar motor switch protein FliG [Methylicorpusculum sp.]|uniref:flagellar motor switch protein FliG n=1 Tax=Methylicorpusculum sp. TaxID=2713644 RepID=UPI002715C28C|nr:flagellar motor switch protein FliG [Methylicorpusculum sp.]MDO8938066.1 flagellar motor switch protein FliG [Methylicorpusculum sp.]MDP2180564.1 flagellar motor switch protein FliG [Methylicorpusculum sp.]MDP2202175.1 flagellar motor switch protein FliG [Methylicorpusculum sp.]MDP3527724.1 flagellar motor switch protein FliG [Methylicorpusculum sp.]MDZ4154383.1 flagellar motor switch protein FliG [Methylicorpusculum sp.]
MAESNALNYAQRASLLLLAVGEDRAAAVLKHMGPKEVQIIGATMAGLSEITPEMVDGVLEEFITTVKRQTGLGLNSDEYIRNMLTGALGADKAGNIIDRILLGANSKGIEQLKWMDTRSIADLIRLEHPQIIAIILTLLESDLAADVLSLLPENTRSDILMRIATMEGIQPAALRELDEIMEKQLTGNDGMKLSAIGGIDAVANILNFLDGGISETVMEDIGQNSADLAQQIQDKMFVFADLVEVDDRGIQTLLREVSTDQLLLALRGVDDKLKNKIFGNMSKRAAEMLRDDLEAAPPSKLSDVELAQKEILAIARKLADSGEIMLGGGSDELV